MVILAPSKIGTVLGIIAQFNFDSLFTIRRLRLAWLIMANAAYLDARSLLNLPSNMRLRVDDISICILSLIF